MWCSWVVLLSKLDVVAGSIPLRWWFCIFIFFCNPSSSSSRRVITTLLKTHVTRNKKLTTSSQFNIKNSIWTHNHELNMWNQAIFLWFQAIFCIIEHSTCEIEIFDFNEKYKKFQKWEYQIESCYSKREISFDFAN